METKITIPALDVWDFFQKNKSRLAKEMVVIAENPGTGYAVYLTEEDDFPLLVVCKGTDAPEYEEGAINQRDCEASAIRCYTQYLYPVEEVLFDDDKDDDDGEEDEDDRVSEKEIETEEEVFPSRQSRDDLMYEREDELELALCDFLEVVLDQSSDIIDTYGHSAVSEILDDVLDYLGLECGLPVYRPMFVVDENGYEVYTDFPYDPDMDEICEEE